MRGGFAFKRIMYTVAGMLVVAAVWHGLAGQSGAPVTDQPSPPAATATAPAPNGGPGAVVTPSDAPKPSALTWTAATGASSVGKDGQVTETITVTVKNGGGDYSGPIQVDVSRADGQNVTVNQGVGITIQPGSGPAQTVSTPSGAGLQPMVGGGELTANLPLTPSGVRLPANATAKITFSVTGPSGTTNIAVSGTPGTSIQQSGSGAFSLGQ